MKKVLFSVFFFSMLVAGAQAQKSTCSKSSCTAKPAAAMGTSCGDHNGSAASANTAEYHAAAAKLASTDPTIEAKTNPVNGEVCYVRKTAGTAKGEFTYVDLTYDATSNAFVNVSPMKMEGCSGKAASGGKSCCAGPAGAGAAKPISGTTTTGTTTPACCAGKTKSSTASSNKN